MLDFCPCCNTKKHFYFKQYAIRCETCGVKREVQNGITFFNFNDIFMEWKLKQSKALAKEIFIKELELINLKKQLKKKSLKPQPKPRYDDVYFEGVEALDKL